MTRFRMPDALVGDVLGAIGAERPQDAAGVAELYRAFCAAVPFDPVMKAVAVREGSRPPGADPVEVAERFLSTGLGGTCWATCGVLAALLDDAGLEPSIALDRMLDVPHVDFHCFVVVDAGDGPVALDPVHVSGRPLPLDRDADGDHPVYRASLRTGRGRGGGRVEHHWEGTERGGRYAVLSTVLDVDDVAALCDVSVHHTGVRAARLFQRTVSPDGIRSVRPTDAGRGLCVRTWRAGGPIRPPGDTGPHGATGPNRPYEETEVRVPGDDVEGVAAALDLRPGGLDLLEHSGLARRTPDGWRFATG